MLIRISVENFKSFDQPGELAMVASGKIRVKPEHRIMSGETPLLKQELSPVKPADNQRADECYDRKALVVRR